MDTNGGTPHGRAGPSPNVQAVDAEFAELRGLEHARRLADAARLRALARILALAVPTPVGQAGPGSAGGAHAARARMIAYRSLRFELASTLSTSEHVAERMLDTAAVASEQYAESLATLEAGAISLPHVEVIVAEGSVFTTGSPEHDIPLRRRYEREVLEVARHAPPQRLRPIARRIAAELAEVPLAERHREARERRHVRVTEETDGMSLLTAFLPSVDAHAIHDGLTRRVAVLRRSSGSAPSILTRPGNSPRPATCGIESASTTTARCSRLGATARAPKSGASSRCETCTAGPRAVRSLPSAATLTTRSTRRAAVRRARTISRTSAGGTTR
ncbi:DUF222 domain-containing protein [Leucobacter chromiireducens]|uniref:DUF222 domain-containing protein n=1 Tax=Leucobacter chromiireducens subsp. chromiireducens TaxID=660067 RepID=A0ABS1STN6_9MICO|nr:DUF222 domain-containing protein [Leucobacter chromiireducens]MBL3690874.1 DUF222 domain-containing protein [Leucobacter chromiireducens subsp. chromiireducens]